ncbi:hypothetical protein FGG08_004259 [Glutinoglossum americanum]|uniref:Uncharacterized protein n=1 Tax=Glutinoglossum americanum TaxID=1670608 RepID=A0A9P8L2W8_9PEZI|nr:hypothetical protein FGG08_004259 [Glutinoglossum americanum]
MESASTARHANERVENSPENDLLLRQVTMRAAMAFENHNASLVSFHYPTSSNRPSIDIAPFHLYRVGDKERRIEGLKRLNYRPLLLQNWVLLTHIAIILGWTGFLIFLLFRARPLRGNPFTLDGYLWGYISTGIRFLAQQQSVNLGKIMPYCSMASSPEDRGGAKTVTADYYPYDWPVPRFRLWRNGHRFYFLTELSTFLSTFALVQFSSNILRGVWGGDDFLGYLPNKGIVYIVIACNAVLLLSTVSTFLWLCTHDTGLFAEPGSLAFLIGMLQNSNVLDDFSDMDRDCSAHEMRKRLKGNYYSIGYFRRSSGSNIVYTIGIADDDLTPKTRMNPGSQNGGDAPRTPSLQQPGFLPWFLSPLCVTLWIGLAIAALSVALTLLVHDSILDQGFPPHAPTRASPVLQMSAAGFLWSFVPAYVADLYRLLWKNTDLFYRIVQPYADLRSPRPAEESSLMLNYTACLPVVITLKAAWNGHWKIALVSLLSFLSSFTTSLAANMFYLDWFSDHQHGPVYPWIVVNRIPFLIMTAYFGIIAIAFSILMPDRKRRLPHDIETLADHISLLCRSSLRGWEAFSLGSAMKKPREDNFRGKWLGKLKAANPLDLFRDGEYERAVKGKLAEESNGDPGCENTEVALGVFKHEDNTWHMGIDSRGKLEFLIDGPHRGQSLWKRFVRRK